MSNLGDKDNGEHTPVPEKVESEDTGRISRELHAQAAMNVGGMQHTPPSGTITPESFVDLLSDKMSSKVVEKMNGKKFLGLDTGGWTSLLLPIFLAGLVGLGIWHFRMRDSIQARPTSVEVNGKIKESSLHHADNATAHPPIQKRLETIEKDQRTIRESQIEQVATDKAQTQVLGEIKEDLKRLMYRHRKNDAE